MKIKILATALLIFSITGCQKQPEQANAAEPQVDMTAKAEFELSDNKISKFLDQLDNPSTLKATRTQILCKDYPAEYKTHYMPALLKLTPTYTEAGLLSDLDSALNYYKNKDDIQC